MALENLKNLKWKRWAIGAAFASAAAVTVPNCYEIVQPKSFGVRITGGELQDKVLSPGFYLKYPVLDNIYTFKNNTIILEANVGSGNNTKDQNQFVAGMRVHYKISPNAGILAFHIQEMGGDNGQQLVVDQMDKAMNAVVGQRSTPETLVAPAEVLEAFVQQLQWRLKQNNIAVEIDTVEFLSANMGNMTLPVQLKQIPGKPVESMAGPSVPVQHLKIVVNEEKTAKQAAIATPAAAPTTAPVAP